MSKNKDLIEFFSELNNIYSQGFTLSTQINSLQSKLGQNIWFKLKQGESLSNILKNYNLDNLTLNLLCFAEKNSNLKTAVKEILKYYQTKEKNQEKLIRALIYPFITFIFSCGLILFFILYIYPIYQESFGLKLNFNLIQIISCLIFIIFTLKYFIKNNPLFEMHFQKNLLLILQLTQQITPDFSQAFYQLNIPEKQKSINQCIFLLKKGLPLSIALTQSALLKETYIKIIMQAEKINNLKDTLLTLAQKAEEDYYTYLNQLILLCEPAVTIFTGVVVGFTAWQMLKPIFQISQTLI